MYSTTHVIVCSSCRWDRGPVDVVQIEITLLEVERHTAGAHGSYSCTGSIYTLATVSIFTHGPGDTAAIPRSVSDSGLPHWTQRGQ